MRGRVDRSSVLTAVLTVMLLPGIAEAQLSERAAWAANVPNEYRVVPDLLEGPNRRDPVVEWLGGLSDRFEVAKRVTPLNYVPGGSSADTHDPR